MRSLNPNIHPHDGFWFKERDGAKIFGDTWRGVVARVIAYRKRAGYPEGNVTEEVTAQACNRNPVLCHDGAAHENELKKMPLKSKVLSWLNRMTQQKDRTFVETQMARDRAAVCATCPMNQGLQESCSSCKAALKVLREQVIGNRFQDGRLNACAVLGEDLSASVNLDSQAVDSAELPAHCWRKRTI